MDDRVLMRSLREQGFKVRFSSRSGRKGRSGTYIVTSPSGASATLPEKIYGRHNRADPGAMSRLKQLGAMTPEEWKAHRESQPKQREETGMSIAETEAPITPGTTGADPGISLEGAAGESRVAEPEALGDLDQELKDFGAWVKTARSQKGLSQRELGEMADLKGATAQSMVSRIEQGRGTVNDELLRKVLKALLGSELASRGRLERYERLRVAFIARGRERTGEAAKRRARGESKPAPTPKTQERSEPAKPATSSTPAAGPVTIKHQAPANPAARAKQLLAKLEAVPEAIEELKGLIEPIIDENNRFRANHKKLEEILGRAVDLV